MKKITEYRTKDLAESTALIVSQAKLLRIEREGSTCYFIFENQKNCESISNEFFFGDLQVNARDFYENMNRLKNRIFS